MTDASVLEDELQSLDCVSNRSQNQTRDALRAKTDNTMVKFVLKESNLFRIFYLIVCNNIYLKMLSQYLRYDLCVSLLFPTRSFFSQMPSHGILLLSGQSPMILSLLSFNKMVHVLKTAFTIKICQYKCQI